MKHRVIYIVFCFSFLAYSQEEQRIQQAENFIYDGNKSFDASNSVEAEKNYRRALAIGEKKEIAQYNMGTTLQQESYVDEALQTYAEAIKTTKEKPNKHRTFHNIGNALMQNKDYKGAVEAYKNALRNNPNDDETRYNYALAKKLLEDQQDDQNQDQQDNKDNQDQENDQNQDQKDDQNQDKEGDNQEDKKDSSQDKGDKDQDQKEPRENDNKDPQGDQENKQPQPQPAQLSPQQVQNLLEAMSNEEKKVQDKINAQKVKPAGTKNKKDW